MKKLAPFVATVALLTTVAPLQTPVATAKQEIKEQKFTVKKCKRSRKFRESQVHFGHRAIIAGRCITDRPEGRGIKVIWSRPGHHPSAGRALDIMTNTKGSCKANRKTGFKVAHHFMKYAKQYGVMYIIWSNRYWSAADKKKPVKNWRYMGRPGCTHGHHDHVHLALK